MKKEKSGSRTLLWSMLMSLPGPLVVGLGLLVGRSTTQIADFIRRSSELLAIIMSFAVYRITTADGNADEERKRKLERISNAFIGVMMSIGGAFMLFLSFLSDAEDKGNVIPGLTIAFLGVIANTLFWIKYTRLDKENPNAILSVQARLYRAKSLVDCSVASALLALAIKPSSMVSDRLDLIGSIIVSVYLIWCGIRTAYEAIKKRPAS